MSEHQDSGLRAPKTVPDGTVTTPDPPRRGATLVFNREIARILASGPDRLAMIVDAAGVARFVSSGLKLLLGDSGKDLEGNNLLNGFPAQQVTDLVGAVQSVIIAPELAPVIELIVEADSTTRVMQAQVVADDSRSGKAAMVTLLDVTDRRVEQQRMMKQMRWFRALTDHSRDAILLFDANSNCLFSNGAIERVLGITPSEVTWHGVIGAIHTDDRRAALQRISDVCRSPGASGAFDCRMLDTQGRTMYVEARAYNGIQNPDLNGFALYLHDVTHRKLHDPVTGLPTKPWLEERLREAIARYTKARTPYVLLMVEIERLGALRSSLTDRQFDGVCEAFAQRLVKVVGAQRTVTRLSTGEFAVFGEGQQDEGPNELAQRIHLSLFRPVEVDGHGTLLTVTIGSATARPRLTDPNAVIAAARAAANSARSDLGQRHQQFQSTIARDLMMRLTLENDLPAALEQDQLEVYLQPIAVLGRGELVGAEALLRWQHPVRGRVSPAVFIPIAEETGAILDIGEWVLRQACQHLAKMDKESGIRLAFVSVNVSPAQLFDPGLVERFETAVRDGGVTPSRVKLEITESAFIRDPEGVGATLKQLTERGFRLALDDFGTGFSSLSHLRKFDFHTLKIDRSFVTGLAQRGTRAARLLEAMVRLGASLDMNVVAEGVETIEQAKLLEDWGCQLAQGYLFGKPMPVQELVKAYRDDSGGAIKAGAETIESLRALIPFLPAGAEG